MLLLLLLLLWTVLLSARVQAQSGEADTDMAPTVSCTSHISAHERNNISCQLISMGYDDDDEDEDAIENMTACYWDTRDKTMKCAAVLGETLSSDVLNPIVPITLTVLTKKGHRIERLLNLRKIIKPKSPQVYNVALTKNRALVDVQTPYQNDYLKEGNLEFQLQLWSEKTNQTQVTSGSMNIGMSHLRSGTQYHVKVRAKPRGFLRGTWSEWSQPYAFNTPPSETSENLSFMLWWIIVPVVGVVVMVVSVVFAWKNKILTYMWPSIPHPKTTLEQICGPTNGRLLFYIPEEFSSLNVYTSVSQSAGPSCGETEPVLSSAGTNETTSCSTQSTDASMSTSSVGTEELELLSQNSTSEEEHDIPSDDLSIENTGLHSEPPETPPTEHNSTQNEQDDSYVTMSSFYQIKTAEIAGRTAPRNLIMT